jgi:heterotetrameric sarcosine oxidase gamma subunit
MPEIRSALAGLLPFQSPEIAIGEITGRDLVQLAGWPDSFPTVTSRLGQICDCAVPQDTLFASTNSAMTLFRIGPERIWLVAPAERNFGKELRPAFTSADAVVADLGQSRTVLRISGPLAADLLARFIAIDLDDRAFPVGRFAQTALLHTGALVHRVAANDFDLYVPRSYAVSIWESVAAAAELLPTALSP